MPRECLKSFESKSKVQSIKKECKAVVANMSTSFPIPTVSSDVVELKRHGLGIKFSVIPSITVPANNSKCSMGQIPEFYFRSRTLLVTHVTNPKEDLKMVITTETRNPNPEPNVAPDVAPIPKASNSLSLKKK
ncbi:hypothetical protein Tco_0820447 [Tanacetum coccineum]|uniref:Uncharacterized protein n=1 Tax=Tanacetum coccineum TaxID=301880 RepID=A0ABQ5ADH9_9ASTR